MDKNPVFVFTNVQFADLSRVIEFIYKGEVVISEEHLDGFMRTVEILGIKNVNIGEPVISEDLSEGSHSGTSSESSSDISSSSEEEESHVFVPEPKKRRSSLPIPKQRQRDVPTEKCKIQNNPNDPPKTFPCKFCQKLFSAQRNTNEHQCKFFCKNSKLSLTNLIQTRANSIREKDVSNVSTARKHLQEKSVESSTRRSTKTKMRENEVMRNGMIKYRRRFF